MIAKLRPEAIGLLYANTRFLNLISAAQGEPAEEAREDFNLFKFNEFREA